LAFWYSLIFFLTTSIIFAGFYLINKQLLFDQVDNALTTHVTNIKNLIAGKNLNLEQAITKEEFTEEFSEVPGMEIVIMSRTGSIVGSSLNTIPERNKINEFFKTAAESNSPFFKEENIDNTTLRLLVSPVYRENILDGVVIVGHPIGAIKKSLEVLFTTLATLLIGLVILTIAGGYLLAQSAVRPVTNMSRKLKKINSETLDERVEIPPTKDEIAELARTFNDMLDRLAAAFTRERQFIGDVAHELKTPLATLRGTIEIALTKDRDAPDYRKSLKSLLKDVSRLTDTVKNILDLAWYQTENNRRLSEKIDLSALLKEIKDIAVKMVYYKKIAVIGRINRKIFVMGNKDKLFRAILNVVDNATKYTKQGTISISLGQVENLAVVKISDTGRGISKSDLVHVFERFYRGEKTTKIFGSGLGLAIAKSLIIAHQGKIAITSRIGKGTIVKITLPLAPATDKVQRNFWRRKK